MPRMESFVHAAHEAETLTPKGATHKERLAGCQMDGLRVSVMSGRIARPTTQHRFLGVRSGPRRHRSSLERNKTEVGGRTPVGRPRVSCRAGRPKAGVELTRNLGRLSCCIHRHGRACPGLSRPSVVAPCRYGWPGQSPAMMVRAGFIQGGSATADRWELAMDFTRTTQ
jgi:hypothetical protein